MYMAEHLHKIHHSARANECDGRTQLWNGPLGALPSSHVWLGLQGVEAGR